MWSGCYLPDRMKPWSFLRLLLAMTSLALAQDDSLNLDDLIQRGQQWLQENLDKSVFESLPQLDQEKVQQLFRDLQTRFQRDYVLDLAALKDTAVAVLPLLDASEATQPYAEWLRTRLDYLEVADEFRLSLPPPKVEPGRPLTSSPNPSPELERNSWQKQVAKRPHPAWAVEYAERLKPFFAVQGVPTQLVWIAEVESSFHPKARSPAGAVGLFQLMPSTTRSLGLALTPIDERLEPEKSAEAAAKYLKYLYGRFQDWPLVMAAYNAGESHVRSLFDRHQAKTFDQISTRLPAETQMYVPRIDATLQRREGVTLNQLQAPHA
jgi:membrane-bound lytic murein transglycosylase D